MLKLPRESCLFLHEPLVLRPINTMMYVASATASRARSDDELNALYHGGGATKLSARPVATRRADGGCGRSLRWSSSKMAKHRLPPPALISPHKPHLHTSSYLWDGALRCSERASEPYLT